MAEVALIVSLCVLTALNLVATAFALVWSRRAERTWTEVLAHAKQRARR
jgi:hypothetical protein